MKLVYKIVLTLTIPMILTVGLWGWFSYKTMEKKIHADTDLILKEYSDNILLSLLSGQELPERFNGAYNTYYFENLTEEQAKEMPAVKYGEAEVFLKRLEDFASSRTRSQVFEDNEGNYRRLTVSLPVFEQDVLVGHVFWWTIMLFGVLLLSVLLIGIVLINYNMKPLYRLLDWIDRYEPGEPCAEVPSDTDIVEFSKLASAVQDAVARFEAQYQERKIFIGNASHELQTPLAVCINRLEMMLERSDLTEELAGELVKVHRSLNGLVRLNKTMLLLSKIENGQFPQTASVDVNALAIECLQQYQEMYSYKNISVNMDESHVLRLQMDEQMASVLVGNLLKNAFVHTPENGTVWISFTGTGFSVSNTGATPLDKNMVFRRFYQPSGRKEGSTGLGLALVNSICSNNGLESGYEFADGKHVFKVNLKKN